MLDWPEPTQTSPMRTLSSLMVFLPATVSVWALPSAWTAGSWSFHLPSASATAVTAWPASSFAETLSPASAQPHSRTGICCWIDHVAVENGGEFDVCVCGRGRDCHCGGDSDDGGERGDSFHDGYSNKVRVRIFFTRKDMPRTWRRDRELNRVIPRRGRKSWTWTGEEIMDFFDGRFGAIICSTSPAL